MSPTVQKRSFMVPARYLLALLAIGIAGCGSGENGEEIPAPGRIAVDADPLGRSAHVKPLGAAVESGHAREDAAYRRRLITEFSSVTPENGMKWTVIHPERDRFDFEE